LQEVVDQRSQAFHRLRAVARVWDHVLLWTAFDAWCQRALMQRLGRLAAQQCMERCAAG
jgi:hypothetical protein